MCCKITNRNRLLNVRTRSTGTPCDDVHISSSRRGSPGVQDVNAKATNSQKQLRIKNGISLSLIGLTV